MRGMQKKPVEQHTIADDLRFRLVEGQLTRLEC